MITLIKNWSYWEKHKDLFMFFGDYSIAGRASDTILKKPKTPHRQNPPKEASGPSRPRPPKTSLLPRLPFRRHFFYNWLKKYRVAWMETGHVAAGLARILLVIANSRTSTIAYSGNPRRKAIVLTSRFPSTRNSISRAKGPNLS